MNILFLTAELINSATGYCAKTVAEALARRGHYVHVVSADRTNRECVECEGHLIIHEVPGNCCRLFLRNSLNSKKKIKRLVGLLFSLLHKLLVQIKGMFTVIPLSNDASALYKKASSIIEKESFQCVIPVVNPRESVMVANRLFHNYRIPYIPYYLDSICGNIGLRFLPLEINRKKALNYEQIWISEAISIIMMQTVKGVYDTIDKKRYSYILKIDYLDIPMLSIRPNIVTANKRTIFEKRFVILFIGTMPNRIRDPRYVFQLVDAIAKEDIHFYFAGKSDYMNDLNALINRNQNVHFMGQIEHSEIPNYVNEADVLLNIGNSIAGMLPSKVFEYMSYQKPILSTIKLKNDLSIPYLKQYGAVHIIDETQPLRLTVDETQRFIRQVKSGEFEINVADLVNKDGALYSNTPLCFCEKVESKMSI